MTVQKLLMSMSTFLAVFSAGYSSLVAAQSCPLIPPPTCDIDNQFASGRWNLDQISGSYEFSGAEQFCEFEDDFCETFIVNHRGDYNPIEGTLNVEKLGGKEENYIDVECDGTVTGKGHERFIGTISKYQAIFNPLLCELIPPYDMNWDVTIERNYDITGNVTGSGQLDLEFDVHTATITIDGNFAWGQDCYWLSYDELIDEFDISGDTEEVRLTGDYDSTDYTWEPEQTVTGDKSWLDDIVHRLELNSILVYGPTTPPDHFLNPALSSPGSPQSSLQLYNQYFVQDSVTITDDISYTPNPETPTIESMELKEPSQYLRDVTVMTDVIVDIDWRDQTPGEVEFTYGGTVETVPGADQVTWSFDAGETGDSIIAIARNDEESQPYSISVPKVVVPAWAESAGSWTGSGGIRYDGDLNWPVSLQTTRTFSTISLFTGLWGISGGVSSDYTALAFSNGSPGNGNLQASADFKFADKSFSLNMNGPNETTLLCDDLISSGSATVVVPGPQWKTQITPFTLVPGIQAGACAISGFLCNVLGSIGIKATAQATLNGTPTYSSQGSEIKWDGGSVGGGISGQISAGVSLPPPIASVANASVWGGASGCINIGVVPDFQIQTLGGQLDAGAQATFMGSSTSATKEWPFGDACGGGGGAASNIAALQLTAGFSAGWVPADGQLAMAVGINTSEPIGAAVWTELPAGQIRPSGDLFLRVFRNDSWGDILQLSDDIESDSAPSIAFDNEGRALIVYQRSLATIPSQPSELVAFANTVELHWLLIDPVSGSLIASGKLTDNAQLDFGPRLLRALDPAANGGIQLFWQQADGAEIAGSQSLPASIQTAGWDAGLQAWNATEVAAANLDSTFGWTATVWNTSKMMIGLSIDTDQDFSTDSDREIVRYNRTSSGWDSSASIVTSDLEVDDSPLVSYDSSGQPLLVWRSGLVAEYLRGDLNGIPEQAFTTPAPDLDGGVSIQFAHGLIAGGNQFRLLWTDGIELLETSQTGLGQAWSAPVPALSTGEVERVHTLMQDGSDLLMGYSIQAAEQGSGQPGLIEPRFVLPTNQAIFSDSFEGTSP